MKKRMMTWLLVLLAALTLTVPSFAEQTEDDLLIYDAAELLNEDEWLELELLADEITWRYNCSRLHPYHPRLRGLRRQPLQRGGQYLQHSGLRHR